MTDPLAFLLIAREFARPTFARRLKGFFRRLANRIRLFLRRGKPAHGVARGDVLSINGTEMMVAGTRGQNVIKLEDGATLTIG